MQLKPIAVVTILLLVASLSVAGCTSSGSLTINSASVAAHPSTYYDGNGKHVVELTASMTNQNAGTVKLAYSNWYLQGKDGTVYNSLTAGSDNSAISQNGETFTSYPWFLVKDGFQPAKVTYNDGQNTAEYNF